MNLDDQIVARIKAAMPDARVELSDLTGGGDHWEALIVSETFAGQSRIQRHRAVHGALGELLHGPVHAFTFKARTPAEAGE